MITVCDQAAGESCQVISAKPTKFHWSIPDPAKAQGTETEINAAFDQSFTLLKGRIEELVR